MVEEMWPDNTMPQLKDVRFSDIQYVTDLAASKVAESRHLDMIALKSRIRKHVSSSLRKHLTELWCACFVFFLDDIFSDLVKVSSIVYSKEFVISQDP
jgi:hypothetical protein